MLKLPANLVGMNKIRKNSCSKKNEAGRLAQNQKSYLLAALYRYGL